MNMNLPTIAIILENHSLSKIYSASKIVHMANSVISDESQHISIAMTGKEISDIYKALSYQDQTALVELEILDEKESSFVINQIELLNETSNSEGKMTRKFKDLTAGFLVTSLLAISIIMTMLYHYNATSNKMGMDSNLLSFIKVLLEEVQGDDIVDATEESFPQIDENINDLTEPDISKSPEDIEEDIEFDIPLE